MPLTWSAWGCVMTKTSIMFIPWALSQASGENDSLHPRSIRTALLWVERIAWQLPCSTLNVMTLIGIGVFRLVQVPSVASVITKQLQAALGWAVVNVVFVGNCVG